MSDLIKRFSVELNGTIVATCSTLEEAKRACPDFIHVILGKGTLEWANIL